MEGSAEDGGYVRLDELLGQLAAVKGALKATERVIGIDKGSVDFQVTALSFASPYRVKLRGVPNGDCTPQDARLVMRSFPTYLRMIRHRRMPHNFDLDAAEKFKNLADKLRKPDQKVTMLDANDRAIAIDGHYRENLNRLIGRDEFSPGAVMGMLEQMNVHANNSQFTIYPRIGPKKVVCKFKRELLGAVLSAAGKYIQVDGLAVYKQGYPFPYAMRVQCIHVFGTEGVTQLSEIRGLSPDATKGEPSEVFVRKLRDANW